MKILELYLENFRCFDKVPFEFSEKFNVLIGDNATGKTVILDALAIAAGSLFLGIDSIPSHNISKNDIRLVKRVKGETPTIETMLPVSLSSKGIFENAYPLSWSRELTSYGGKTTYKKADDIRQYAEDLQQQVRHGEIENFTREVGDQRKYNDGVILPIISYYKTGRLWIQNKQTKKNSTLSLGSRFRGYENYLNTPSEIKRLMQWFKTWEWASVQKGKPLNTLVGVKEAIKNCMDDWQDIRYDVQFDELMATSKDGRILPFQMLSDGVRNMIGMVADIAYRCVTLNPQFESEAARKTPGIVLIDEIELHLHPKWQRRVVEDLKRTFPKIQFIVTTHSPFIIQSLHPNEDKLINLNTSPPTEYAGRSIEDIIEDIMGIELPQYSRRKLAMLKAAEEYYQVLQEAGSCDQSDPIRLKKLKERLDELSSPFSDNPAYHAFLKMERLAKGV